MTIKLKLARVLSVSAVQTGASLQIAVDLFRPRSTLQISVAGLVNTDTESIYILTLA